MATATCSAEDVQRFYRVGALGLRALQDRGLSAERFGAEASARYRAFKGELTDGHRLDLALRDGAAMHPLAFAARSVFSLPGLAADEPFGPSWLSLVPSRVLPILREVEAPAAPGADAPIAAVLAVLANLLGLVPQPADPERVASIVPASRVIVAGGGAIIAVAGHMAGKGELAFCDQVLLVSATPALRQLAGIAAALTGSRKSPLAVSSRSAARGSFDRATTLVISADAPPTDTAEALALAEELGAG